MTVEAAQFMSNREFLNPVESNINHYDTQMGCSFPLSGTAMETMIQAYHSWMVDSVPVKSESDLTYNLPVQRKRNRDSLRPSYKSITSQSQNNPASFSFLGEDISLLIQQQQLEIECLIAQHMAMVRMEIEEKRKRQSIRMMEVAESVLMKKLKSKEDELDKLMRLNWALEEQVKSLCLDNQMWRDLAQTHEATAITLRTNLEQLLSQVHDHRTLVKETVSFSDDDAQSCCGSNAAVANEEDEVIVHGNRLCRNCFQEDCCVLLLPCRHLCLCTVCSSSLQSCPICKSIKNASVHVNMA